MKHRKIIVLIIVLVIILAITSVVWGSKSVMSYDEKAQKLDNYMEQFFQDEVNPSISILIIDDGKAVYRKSFGYANLQTLEVATPCTNYRIASISKMFTAMSIVILKDRGLLGYDDRVQDILDDFPDYGKNITVKHLLNHTSGLRDYNDELLYLLDGSFDENNQLIDSDVYEMIKKADSTYFKPGSKFRYSDT